MCVDILYVDICRARALTPPLLLAAIRMYSYAGLASLWVGRELDDKGLIQRGVECEEKISKLATSASVWNFENSEFGHILQ